MRQSARRRRRPLLQFLLQLERYAPGNRSVQRHSANTKLSSRSWHPWTPDRKAGGSIPSRRTT